MVVGEVASRTDVVVVGGGPGGYVAALRCAEMGREVVLVERDRLGGVCLNVGCIPSKALLHAAALAGSEDAGRAWGVHLTAKVDMPALQEAVGAAVDRLSGGVAQLLRLAGVKVVTGTARFSNARRVAIASADAVEHVQFDEAIVATGSRWRSVPGVPVDGHDVIDAITALGFDRVPDTMTIVGGGSTGVELATAFAKLGSAVTIVEAAERLLPAFPAELVRPVAARLGQLGVRVVTGATVSSPTAVPAEIVVVAAGRRPNTDDLGLDLVGVVPLASGHIAVDAARRAAPHVLAIGDVTEGPALAHKAMAEADVAAHTAAGRPAAFDPMCIPDVVFGDPEVASVGLTIAEAKAGGHDPSSFRFPFAASGRAVVLGATTGHVEVVAGHDGTVLGVHMVGTGVAELAGEAALAIEMGATVADLALVIHPHPTMSEALVEASHGLLGRPLHVRGRSR